MPTVPLMQLPRSRSSEEFEMMCADVLSIKYNTTFSRYGRQGQKQNGIDLLDHSGKDSTIVAQCKNYYLCSCEKLQDQLLKDIQASSNIPFSIETYIVMTSLDNDVTVQNFIKKLREKTSFDILIYFWENITSILCNNSHLLNKYYPQIISNFSIPLQIRNELIANALILQKQAENLNGNFTNYKVAYYYNDDCEVYNNCVSIVNAASKICDICQQYHIQLKEIGLIDPIESLFDAIPSFSEETEYGTGASMVYTITKFLNYFTNSNNKNIFISLCEQIIECVKNLV